MAELRGLLVVQRKMGPSLHTLLSPHFNEHWSIGTHAQPQACGSPDAGEGGGGGTGGPQP